MLIPFAKRVCKDVESWVLSCGVVHAAFSESSEEQAVRNMQNLLDRAAVELSHEPNSVVVLDDFNFCFGKCQAMMKELLTQHTLNLPNGQKISASKLIIILTSDLTHLGVDIQRGESYEQALEQVEAAAKQFWGETSLISSVARIIPFAPLSDGEIIKVVDKMMILIERDIRFRINLALQKLEEADNFNEGFV